MRTHSACLLVALLTACNSGYSSGVDGSKPFSAVTDQEAATACQNLADYFESSFPAADRIEFQCTIEALTMVTSTPDECQANVNACIASTTNAPPLDVDCSNPMADPDCNATVGQVEDCLTALVEAQLMRRDEVTCAVAGNVPELTRLRDPVPTPPECSSIEPICPNVPGV